MNDKKWKQRFVTLSLYEDQSGKCCITIIEEGGGRIESYLDRTDRYQLDSIITRLTAKRDGRKK